MRSLLADVDAMVVAALSEIASAPVSSGRAHDPVIRSNQRKHRAEAILLARHHRAKGNQAIHVTASGALISFAHHDRTPAKITHPMRHRPVSKQRLPLALHTNTIIRRNDKEKTRPREVTSVHEPPAAPAQTAPAAPLAATPDAPPDITGIITSYLEFFFALLGLFSCAGFICHASFYRSKEILELMGPQRSTRISSRFTPRVRAVQDGRQSVSFGPADSSDNLEKHLREAGVALHASENTCSLEDLRMEVQAGTCEVLWVDDPVCGHRLIRLVRLLRCLVTLPSEEDGESILIETSRTMQNKTDGESITRLIGRPASFKLKLDEDKPLHAGMELMASRLNIERLWLDTHLKADNNACSYVEEENSEHYPGLPTWYLIEEWKLHLDTSNIAEEDSQVIGHSDRQAFQTVSSNDGEAEIIHSWEWLPKDAVAKARWNTRATSTQLSVGNFQAAASRRMRSSSRSPSVQPGQQDGSKGRRFSRSQSASRIRENSQKPTSENIRRSRRSLATENSLPTSRSAQQNSRGRTARRYTAKAEDPSKTPAMGRQRSQSLQAGWRAGDADHAQDQ